MSKGTAVANLPDIDELVAGYDAAIELYGNAFDKIEAASKAIEAAQAAIERVTPGAKFHHANDATEVKEFFEAVQLPDRASYLRTARKLLTVRGWHYVVDRCGMQQLMDAQAKKEIDAQLRYVPDRPRGRYDVITKDEAEKGPPPFTADNIRATIAKFAGDSEMIWRRGIANVFSQLDRRFRSHDGFKVGSRIILNHFVGSWGYIETYGATAERFRDIERTFKILDGGDPRQARAEFLHTIEAERKELGLHGKAAQSLHEGPYFRVRIFQNGNAHLWFVRDDLVEKVNRELAAYYGEVIGDEQTREPDPLESRALTTAKAFGFYPTPGALAESILRQVPNNGSQRILEPSAGTGNLAIRLAKPTKDHDGTIRRHIVDAIEIQPALADGLRRTELLNRVTMADFLQVAPDPIYDGVVMNPPFDKEADITHVCHAAKFLKEGGWLLAIMSAGTEYRETSRAAAFRKTLANRGGWMIDLPHGAFASVGTNVNTILVGFGMRKPYHL